MHGKSEILEATPFLTSASVSRKRRRSVSSLKIGSRRSPRSTATASQPAHVSFTLPCDFHDPVPDLPGALGTDQRDGPTGRRVVVRTGDLQQTLTATLGWGASRGLVLADLNARPASLEEAFLAVAGAATEHTHGRGVAV